MSTNVGFETAYRTAVHRVAEAVLRKQGKLDYSEDEYLKTIDYVEGVFTGPVAGDDDERATIHT